MIRGYLAFTRYRRLRDSRRHDGARAIQSNYRGYNDRKDYENTRACMLKCQANVVARQCRRSYLRFKYSIVRGQSVIRRFLTLRWARKIKSARLILENKLRTLQSMVIKYRYVCPLFSPLVACFTCVTLWPNLQRRIC